MATAAPTGRLTWASFALTDWRWLLHALGWSVALWAAMLYAPWFFMGLAAIAGLGLIAAVATGHAGPASRAAPPAATIVRYALVDATFVTFAAPFLILPLHLALAAASLLPLVGSPRYAPIPTFIFVCAFYAGLGATVHARAAARLRRIPLAASAVVAALLAAQAWAPFKESSRSEAARSAGVAAYEKAAGRLTGDLDKLRIGNSLAGVEARVSAIAVDGRDRLLVSGGFLFYGGRDGRGLVRLLPDGRLDETFAPLPPGDPALNAPTRVIPVDDGSLVVNRVSGGGLSRLRADGTLDPAFSLAYAPEAADPQPLEAFDRLPDSSIVAAMPSRLPASSCIVRIRPDGTRDAAFEGAVAAALFGAAGSSAPCLASGLATLASGAILVHGAFPATGMRAGLLRLAADGTLDAAYRPQVDFGRVSRWRAAPGGEVLAVSYEAVSGSPPSHRANLVRMLPDGGIDGSFRPAVGAFARIDEMTLQPDGKLIVAGTQADGLRGAIVRLMPDGRLDDAFKSTAGTQAVDGFVTAIAVQRDGRVVLGGEFQEIGGATRSARVARQNLARLLPDGALDPTFVPR